MIPYGFVLHKDKSNYYPISELFTIQKGELASENGDDNGEYDFITASETWKKHSMYQLDGEALVYANDSEGSLGRCHYVNGKFMASNLCLVLQEKNHKKYPLDLEYYSYYFMSIREQITSRLKDGTSKLTISKEKFERYRIEYVPFDEQLKRKGIIKRRMQRLNELSSQMVELQKILYNMQA